MIKAERIRSLVGEGRILEAIDLLEGAKTNIISLKTRWNGLQDEINMGIIDDQDAKLERNRIVKAILTMATQMERLDLNEYEESNNKKSNIITPPTKNINEDSQSDEQSKKAQVGLSLLKRD